MIDAWLRSASPIAPGRSARRLAPSLAAVDVGGVALPAIAARRAGGDEARDFDVQAVDALGTITVLGHGSFADGTECAFSDVDVVALVWPAAFETATSSERTLSVMLRILQATLRRDPLQHHPPQIVACSEDADWSFDMFPPLFVEELVWLAGPDPRGGAARVAPPSPAIARETWAKLLKSLRAMMSWDLRNAYLAKGFVSTVLLLPPVHAQAGGEPLSKRDALARPPDALRDIVDIASHVRADWEYSGSQVAQAVRRHMSYRRGVSVVSRVPQIRTAPHLRDPLRQLRSEVESLTRADPVGALRRASE
jgi:hypothetical protein